MQDLIQDFSDPNILDIKLGTRTFQESEVKNPVLRKDLYEKMVKLNVNEPTAEEHEQKAITKLRYMQVGSDHLYLICLLIGYNLNLYVMLFLFH